jgi:hypothetical protein
MTYIFLFALLCTLFIFFFKRKEIYVKTAAMAVVMAFGIIIQGVLFRFFGQDFFYSSVGKTLTIVTVSLWIGYITSFVISFTKKIFSTMHFADPNNRFTIGTWIAATSICGILLYEQFPILAIYIKALFFLNAVGWVLYCGVSCKTFITLNSSSHKNNIHGVVLLPTVATQSIVVFMNILFSGALNAINLILIVMGACFYLCSCYFIVRRYLLTTWSIEDNWNNTNCIFHGAISITGLATIMSNTIKPSISLFIWIGAVTVFVIVEVIECYRLYKRIKLYGLKRGAFIFDISQWSRIFTFAMLYTFTSYIEPNQMGVLYVQKFIIIFGSWFILALLFMELTLFIRHFALLNLAKIEMKEKRGFDI